MDKPKPEKFYDIHRMLRYLDEKNGTKKKDIILHELGNEIEARNGTLHTLYPEEYMEYVTEPLKSFYKDVFENFGKEVKIHYWW